MRILKSRYLALLILSFICREPLFALPDKTVEQDSTALTPSGILKDFSKFESTDQENVLDMFIGDAYQGFARVSVSNSKANFIDPEESFSQLSGLKDPEKVKPLFTEPDKLLREIKGVGRLEIRPNLFQVVLNLDPDMLTLSSLDFSGKVNPSDAPYSFRQDISYTATDGTSQDVNSIGLFDSFVGLKEGWLRSRWQYLNDPNRKDVYGSYEIIDASANFVQDTLRYSAGALQSNPQRFSPYYKFAGISIQTIEQTYLKEETLRGSRFELFLQTRSRVEFYQGARLLDIQYINQGFHEIDTTKFPQGSYQVDIVISDSSGTQRRERKYFTKSGLLALRGFPTYIAEFGAIRDDLTLQDKFAYQTGVSWRAFDFAQIESIVYGSDVHNAASLEFRGLVGNWQWGLGGAASTKFDPGYIADLNGSLFSENPFRFDFGVSYQKTYSEQFNPLRLPTDSTTRPPQFDDFDTRFSKEVSVLNYSSTYISKRFDDLEIRYEWTKSIFENQENYYHGPVARWFFYNGNENFWTLNAADYKTQQGDNLTLFLSYQYRQLPWTYEARVNTSKNKTEGRYFTGAGLQYDTRNGRTALGTRARAIGEVGVIKQDEAQDLGSQGSLEVYDGSSIGGITGFGSVVRQDKSQAAYGLSVTNSLTLTENGDSSVSPGALGEALLIVHTNTTSDTPMEVVVNGQPHGTIIGGGSLAVGLQPFQEYSVAVRPAAKSELVDYEVKTEKVVLYPGNVVHKTFGVQKVFIALGRLIDKSGEPLASKRLKGAKGYAMTEADGTFQAEVKGDEKITINAEDGSTCSFNIDKLQAQNSTWDKYFKEFGDVVCE